jgi:hypothetical protein
MSNNGNQPQFKQRTSNDDLSELTDADLPDEEQPPRGTRSMLSRDFALGNIRREDWEAHRYLLKNQQELSESERPPEGSMIQGPVRAAFHGDPSDRATPTAARDRVDEHSERLLAEVRMSRSVGGWQQEKLAETRQVQVLDEKQNEQEQDSGGFLGGIFS